MVTWGPFLAKFGEFSTRFWRLLRGLSGHTVAESCEVRIKLNHNLHKVMFTSS